MSIIIAGLAPLFIGVYPLSQVRIFRFEEVGSNQSKISLDPPFIPSPAILID